MSPSSHTLEPTFRVVSCSPFSPRFGAHHGPAPSPFFPACIFAGQIPPPSGPSFLVLPSAFAPHNSVVISSGTPYFPLLRCLFVRGLGFASPYLNLSLRPASPRFPLLSLFSLTSLLPRASRSCFPRGRYSEGTLFPAWFPQVARRFFDLFFLPQPPCISASLPM